MARSTAPLALLAALLVLPLSFVAAQPEATQEGDETTASSPMDEEEAVRFLAPQIILGTQIQPTFPPAAWDARYTGAVLLEMTVLKDGSVGNIEVVRCTTPKVGFEEAAIAAVKQWRFEPGMENGEPIEVKTRLKMNFSRAGVGVRAQPQVSAGAFTVEAYRPTVPDANRGFNQRTSGSPN